MAATEEKALKIECHPISIQPHLSRLFEEYCAAREPIAPFYSASPYSTSWQSRPPALPAATRAAVSDLLVQQNSHPAALANIERLRQGASAVVTGQQVTLFGGPLFTLLKAATAIRKAQEATAAGHPHVPIFWLATEDHDLAEADHTVIPARRELTTLRYRHAGAEHVPVGSIVFGPDIQSTVEEALQLLDPGEFSDLLERCYQPGRTFSQAFAAFMGAVFASHGLIVMDASGRGFHALGASVLRQAIERADELRTALAERDALLASRGYHSQVKAGSALLFLIDASTGERQPVKRTRDGGWQSAGSSYRTEELLALLDSAPERFSPSALLRPVFQDALLPTSAYVGGPAEIAYFAQSQVLYERILGRTTPVLPRLTATLVEPAVAELLERHGLSLEDLIAHPPDELAQRLAARSMPIEGKRALAAAGNALDAELTTLTGYLHSLDAGLGRSGDIAASKMRYQMNRLRRLAANYHLQKEASLKRHVETVLAALYPNAHPQERVIGAAYFLARYGQPLVDLVVEQAGQQCPGHKVLYL